MRNKDIMLILVLLITLSFLIFTIPASRVNSEDFLGVWQGRVNNEQEVEFIFSNNNKCRVSGLNYMGEHFYAKCSINTKKDIVTLTISKISSGLESLYSIMEFIGLDRIRIASFSQKWRTMPIMFNKNTDIVLYKK